MAAREAVEPPLPPLALRGEAVESGGVGRHAFHRDRAVAGAQIGHVVGEQRCGAETAVVLQVGERRRQRAPCEGRRRLSRALDTTAGRPVAAMICRACTAPPSGCALTTITSAAPERATARGSSDLRMLSSAATGCPGSAHGCAARRVRRRSRRAARCTRGSNSVSACTACSASSTFHRPFASTRMRPSGRGRRARPALGPRRRRALPALGDLDLRGAAAGETGEHRGHRGGVDRGHRGVHPDAVAQRRRLRGPGEVDRGREPRGRLGVAVFDEGRELGPALRPFEEQRLAGVDAAEAGVQREGDHARARDDVLEVRRHVPIMPLRDRRSTIRQCVIDYGVHHTVM